MNKFPTFPFPKKPYDCQVAFMKNLYNALEEGKLGIFESPTGTGKSLSIICGAMTWLKHHEETKLENLKKLAEMAPPKDDEELQDGADWLEVYAKRRELQQKIEDAKAELGSIEKQKKRIKEIHQRANSKRKRQDSNESTAKPSKQIRTEDEKSNEAPGPSGSSEVKAEGDEYLLEENESDDQSDEETGSERSHVTKIYYCSRTHSQLAQFVQEVKTSPYGSNTRVVSLGSRQSLCINPDVVNLKNISLMNEACLDMQKKKVSQTIVNGSETKKKIQVSGCPYYKMPAVEQLQSHLFSEVKDIEDIVEMGKKLKACPYYSSRFSIPEAELVVLPYQMLLHKKAREACGIELEGNIVIVDEAHNLIETISNVHTILISGQQLSILYAQLSHYFAKYKSYFNPKNTMHMKQLIQVVKSLITYLGGTTTCIPTEKLNEKPELLVITQTEFLTTSMCDNTNVLDLISFCERRQLSKKLHGFSTTNQVAFATKSVATNVEKSKTSGLTDFLEQLANTFSADETVSPEPETSAESNNSISQTELQSSSPLLTMLEFLRALTLDNKDGRIFVTKSETLSKSSLKFLLLNPSAQFHDIVNKSRSVILVGGTMQPMSEFVDQLFIPAGATASRISKFSSGHVIPAENLLCLALEESIGGQTLEFTYQARADEILAKEVARIIVSLSAIIPGGVICFFPSYEYENFVYNVWEKSGMLSRIKAVKKVFREPKSAKAVELVLSEYSNCIQRAKLSTEDNKYGFTGGLLLSVIGGKMSEGINFADDLGRCVMIVGMPYANVKSPELQEKMNYLSRNVQTSNDGKSAGSLYYENLCMRGVNQSIGRAIRHKDDHAVIVLVDRRYLRPSVHGALPSWISSRLQKYGKFSRVYSAIRDFFQEKEKKEEFQFEFTEPFAV